MSLPHSMTAIAITEPGGPDVLKPVSVPVPVPGHGQILIKIAYAGVNRPDALQRAGAYAPPASAPHIPAPAMARRLQAAHRPQPVAAHQGGSPRHRRS